MDKINVVNIIKTTGLILLLTGLSVSVVSIGADVIGLGERKGIGGKQVNLLVLGLLLFLVGVMMSIPKAQGYIRLWIVPGSYETGILQFRNWQDNLLKHIMIAMWFGTLSGIIEATYRSIQKYLQHSIVNLSPHFVWIVPLTLMFYFFIFGLIFFLLSLRWPRYITFQAFVCSMMALALMSLYYLRPKLNIATALLLIIAISFQLSRFIYRRQTIFFELVEATFPWMATLVIIVAAFMIGLTL